MARKKVHKKIIDLYEKCLNRRKKEWIYEVENGKLRETDAESFNEFCLGLEEIMIQQLNSEISRYQIIKHITKEKPLVLGSRMVEVDMNSEEATQ